MWTKEQIKEYKKTYRQAHKEKIKAYTKIWHESHKEEQKLWVKNNREYLKSYINSELNSIGQTKHIIRCKTRYYLRKYGHKIPGYEIHHCCTYTEPYKFIYCSREMHKLIHSYLRQHNIDADSNHYQYIKHLLDNKVVKYGID